MTARTSVAVLINVDAIGTVDDVAAAGGASARFESAHGLLFRIAGNYRYDSRFSFLLSGAATGKLLKLFANCNSKISAVKEGLIIYTINWIYQVP